MDRGAPSRSMPLARRAAELRAPGDATGAPGAWRSASVVPEAERCEVHVP